MQMQMMNQVPEKGEEEDQVKACLADLHPEIRAECLENSGGFLIHCSWTTPDEEAEGQFLSQKDNLIFSPVLKLPIIYPTNKITSQF